MLRGFGVLRMYSVITVATLNYIDARRKSLTVDIAEN
jgi:hypothetical protein